MCKYCAECKRGENEREADYLITGYDHDLHRPFREYWCSDHYFIADDIRFDIKTAKRL